MSKDVVKAVEAPVSTTNGSQTPYQLDLTQTARACEVLLKHIAQERQRRRAVDGKRNILAEDADDDEDGTAAGGADEPIWLILTTKKHITDQKRLKPSKIPLPHSLNKSATSSICLITADPQKTYADLVESPAFPSELRTRITRVISLSTLKKNYATFESRRALLATHDIFLADDRIVTYLPGALGKIFYKGGSKRPIPISIAEGRERDENGKRRKLDPATARVSKDKIEGGKGATSPESAAKQIVKALDSALVHLAPGTSTGVKVALANMTKQQVVDNVHSAVNSVIDKFVTKGWRNVRAMHIKGPNTASFPIWLASELWVDEEDVLEEKKLQGKKGRKQISAAQSPDSKETEATSPGDEEEPDGRDRKRKADEVKKPADAKHVKKKRKLEAEQRLAEELKDRKKSLKRQKADVLAALA